MLRVCERRRYAASFNLMNLELHKLSMEIAANYKRIKFKMWFDRMNKALDEREIRLKKICDKFDIK